MHDVSLKDDKLDAYQRVMMDHTELITRVSVVEDKQRVNLCVIVLNSAMLALLGAYVWVAGHE
jgi:hypothetical protein